MKCIRIYEAMKCKGGLLLSHHRQYTKTESRNDTPNVSTPVFVFASTLTTGNWHNEQNAGINFENFSYYLFIYISSHFYSGKTYFYTACLAHICVMLFMEKVFRSHSQSGQKRTTWCHIWRDFPNMLDGYKPALTCYTGTPGWTNPESRPGVERKKMALIFWSHVKQKQ